MAKVIRISNDGGTNWYKLPGNTGSFNQQGETAGDAVFGQEFDSNATGLIAWTIDANAVYKGYHGYLARLRRQGTSTVMTDEATTLVSGKTYQIDDTAKRLVNKNVTPTVEDATVAVAAADILNFNYLTGEVTFVSTYTVTGPITVTGEYYPLATLGNSNSYTLGMTADTKDNSTYSACQANGGFRIYDAGLRQASLSLNGIFVASDTLVDELTSRNVLMAEVDPAGNAESVIRGFFQPSDLNLTGNLGALEEENANFELNVPFGDTPEAAAPMAAMHTTASIIPEAIKILIDAWINGTSLKAQYLPSGAPGQATLDGREGTVVVTNFSLSGGLSDMNTFEVTLTGSGAYTTV